VAEQRRAWQRVDPLLRLRKALVGWGVAADEDLDRIDREAQDEARAARSEAEAAPVPDPDSIFQDVFAPPLEVPATGSDHKIAEGVPNGDA
jgi:pyruvate dehydrogenase E1 component alpha subunit